MKTLVRPVILVAIITGVVIGAIAGLLLVTRGTSTTESAATILRKSAAAQSQALATLGANTTLHGIEIRHREQTAALRNASQFAEPDDTIGETFWTFDAAGKLSAYSSVVKGTDGHVYQHAELVGHDLVMTDVASGQTSKTPNWDAITADDLRARDSKATLAVVAALGPLVTAKTATVNGVAAYVIETTPTNRSYVDKNDYHLLRSEQLAPDGNVTEFSMPTVLEVLPGAVTAPTP